MPHTFEITDFLSIKKATIELPTQKVVLIGGPNAEGKSSIALALAAALTGARMPGGETIKTASQYVRWGAKTGQVFYTAPDGTGRRITWKDGEATAEGEAEVIGASAAGLSKLTALRPEERAGVLIDVLGAKVTQKDLHDALLPRWGEPRATKEVPELWRKVQALGFASVLKELEDDGRLLKRQWQEATGKPRWGESAGVWMPEGWTPTLDQANDAELAEAVEEARQQVEQAIKNQAVNEAELTALKAQAQLVAGLESAHRPLKEESEGIAQVLRGLREDARKMPTGEAPESQDCPHCSEPLVVRGGRIEKVVKLSAAQLKKQKHDFDEQLQQVSETEKLLADADLKYRDCTLRLEQARGATKKVLEMESGRSKAKGAAVPEAAREALRRAKQALATKVAKQRADQLHERILDNVFVQDLMAPDGLQRHKLGEALGEFQKDYLTPLCQTAMRADPKWQVVMVDDELGVWFDRCPYGRCSGSEKFRVDTTLQVALALKQQQEPVIIDAADVMLAPGRAGLMAMLTSRHLTAVVTMAVGKRDQLPDLKAKGAGHTLWIEAGEITPAHALPVEAS